MKSALPICFAFFVLVAACKDSSTTDGSLAICRNLPTNTTCSVNLSYLSCTYFDDAGVQQTEICLSDNINQCPDGNGLEGNTCTSLCDPPDYAAVCVGNSDGDAAPQGIAPPSTSCRASTGGSNAYCCPCGS